jgi:hypothetical protein
MKYAVYVDSGAMIYITKFHKDWFRNSINGVRGRHTDSMVISYFL